MLTSCIFCRTRKRGLRNSGSRQCMTSIVVIMLFSSTALVIIGLEFYVVQLPTIGMDNPPDVAHQLVRYGIGQAWIARLNVSSFYISSFVSSNWLNSTQFILSDIIVVWRAWALWPAHRAVRWALAICMGGTFGENNMFCHTLSPTDIPC